MEWLTADGSDSDGVFLHVSLFYEVVLLYLISLMTHLLFMIMIN